MRFVISLFYRKHGEKASHLNARMNHTHEEVKKELGL